MVKETINFNSTPDGIDFLEKAVERLEDENAELLCEVGARREREERVWALLEKWGGSGCAWEDSVKPFCDDLRAALEG